MKMKSFFALALVVSLFACTKEDVKKNGTTPAPQFSTTPYHYFGGYNFYLAGFDFHQEITINDPDPDVLLQALNEKMLYIGMALDAAQCKYHDVAANVLAAVANTGDAYGVTAKDFFDNHPDYQTELNLVLNEYGVPTATFFDPIVMYGYNMVPGIRVPENAVNANEPDAAIAMGIEVKPPFHTEAEDYADDYIPAYFPQDGEECSVETVVGYKDDYDDYTIFPLDEQLNEVTHTLVVITQVEVDGNGVIANKTAINPRDISTNITRTGNNNCEAAQTLETEYGIYRARWQRRGQSRIRAKHLLAIGRPDIINVTWHKEQICELPKSYFDNPYPITINSSPAINEMKEVKAVDQAVIFPTVHNQPAIGRHGIISVYEHDWYGWPRIHYWDPVPGSSKVKLILIAQKSIWENYAQAIIDPMDWCFNSYIVRGYYNNNSEVKFIGK
jgi:hypothetical protein